MRDLHKTMIHCSYNSYVDWISDQIYNVSNQGKAKNDLCSKLTLTLGYASHSQLSTHQSQDIARHTNLT